MVCVCAYLGCIDAFQKCRSGCVANINSLCRPSHSPPLLPPTLQALKANDLEAYQELLMQQQGGGGGAGGPPGEEEQRFAVISKFLGDTETYLEKLANKVAMVRGGGGGGGVGGTNRRAIGCLPDPPPCVSESTSVPSTLPYPPYTRVLTPLLSAPPPPLQVKVSYEIEQYVKEAMEEARRAGGSDDEIRQAGERAAQEYRNDSEVG